MTELEEQVFTIVCANEASIMDRGYPIPSTYISKKLNITLYKARKALKSLKQQGLITSYHTGMYDEMSEQVILMSGYRLTSQAIKTDIYREAEKKESELIDKIWGQHNG